MSIYREYYDLSSDNDDADSLASGSSSSSEENPVGHDNETDERDPLWGRSILHIDVDCFYVQCEEIDRGLRNGDRKELDRPLAIGQKHIVVTCNYVARSRGVTKLMSKTDAMRICPELRIVDGSDLRRYRTHSRTIYEAFRLAVQEEVGSVLNTLNNDKTRGGARTQYIIQGDRVSTDGPSSRPQHQRHSGVEDLLPCKRNAMDEMMADISTAVNQLTDVASKEGEAKILGLISRLSQATGDRLGQKTQQISKTYVFGDNTESSVVRIVEDQTGASSSIVFGGNKTKNQSHKNCITRSLAPTRRNVHEDRHNTYAATGGNTQHTRERRMAMCRKRMEVAVRLARLICESIFRRTGFHVSAGISVSPMLAKLSVIKKPKTVNLLYPWRSPDLLYFMPLRKMHEVGSRTYRALSQVVVPVTSERTKTSSGPIITIYEFLQAPREKIIEALLMMLRREKGDRNDVHKNNNDKPLLASGITDRSFCEQKCDLILERCRGLDSTIVQDDGGGAPQTVSVENSFRRGTMTTEAAIKDALAELCQRLPPLIQDRVAWSRNPPLAYPTTIRLTIRAMKATDPGQRSGPKQKRSCFTTRSKQASIGAQRGKMLLAPSGNSASQVDAEIRATQVLRDSVDPLLQQLLPLRANNYSDRHEKFTSPQSINITRMNLAVSNFQDVIAKASSYHSPCMSSEALSPAGQTASYSIDTNINNSLHQRQLRCTNSGAHDEPNFEGTINKRRKNPFAATPSPSPAQVAKWKRSRDSRSSKDQPKGIRKFSRTRIDQFFANK